MNTDQYYIAKNKDIIIEQMGRVLLSYKEGGAAFSPEIYYQRYLEAGKTEIYLTLPPSIFEHMTHFPSYKTLYVLEIYGDGTWTVPSTLPEQWEVDEQQLMVVRRYMATLIRNPIYSRET